MALSALQASQLASLLAGHAKLFTANNPGQNEFADYLLKSAQSATMGALAEEQEKKKKKAQKGALGGQIGSALGTAAGIALAPVTGGASLALSGAAGGALGGLTGRLLSGGSPNLGSFALDAAQGGLSAYTYGKRGELGTSVDTAATQADVPASPPPAVQAESSIANAIPSSWSLSSPGNAPPNSLPAGVPSFPRAAMAGALSSPGTAGVAVPAPLAPQATSPMAMTASPGAVANATRPGFGARFASAFQHVAQPNMPSRPFRYTLPGGIQVYY